MNVIYISEDKLVDNKENFYRIDEDEVTYLARAIEALNGIVTPLIVKKIDDDHFKIIAGHKRRQAVKFLLSEGKTMYKDLPCIYQEDIDSQNSYGPEHEEAVEMLTLMLTNSSARQHFTPFEKMKEVENLERVLKMNHSSVNVRQAAAELLNMSRSEVGRYQKISKNLSDENKVFFAEGKIKTQTADCIASLSPEQQKLAAKVIMEQGTIKATEVSSLIIPKEQETDFEEIKKEDMVTASELEENFCTDDLEESEEEEQEAIVKMPINIPESNDILLDVYSERTFIRMFEGIQTHHILHKARRYDHWKVGTHINILSSVTKRKIQAEILYINRNHPLLKETAMIIIFKRVR